MAQASAPHPSHEDITAALRALAARWADAKARERGNFQLYMGELCSALGVEGPRPAGSGYEYELPVKIIDRNGKESSNFIDLFKRDHFILEAKDKEAGRSDDLMLRKAYGQARNYVTHLPGTTPPYVMVLDVGKTLVVWDRWEGGFGGFGAGKTVATVPWPGDAIGQITALCALVASGPVAVGRFCGAKKEIVQRHLETMAILGELHAMGDGHYAAPAVVG